MDTGEDFDDLSTSFPNQTYIQRNFKNPMITKFTQSSHFIYDIYEYRNYFQNIKDHNRIKLSKKELDSLEILISKIEYEEELLQGNKFIEINKDLANELFNFYHKPLARNPLELFILNEFIIQENRTNFTCRKLAKRYETLTNKKISKSTIHNILKKVLGLRWRKKLIKTNKIKRKKNIAMMLSFIKIIIRCIILNFTLIYVDESCLQTYNNHLKIWTEKNEDFVAKIAPKRKFNLLMAVNQHGIIHFKINKENTDKHLFLEFMKELVKVINEKKIKPYLIILDNLSCHKTKELFDYYTENKINILFNAPYISKFNAIEYSFRDLKRIIYTKIYNNEDEMIIDVENILKSSDFQKKMNSNFKETYINYLNFYKKEKNFNLNSLDL